VYQKRGGQRPPLFWYAGREGLERPALA
jgi:hypothetical protein